MGHVHDRVHHPLHVHSSLGHDASVGLLNALSHGLRHVAGDIADVNLTDRNLESPAIQVGRFGESRDGMLGGGVGDGGGSWGMGRDGSVVDDAPAHGALTFHQGEGG